MTKRTHFEIVQDAVAKVRNGQKLTRAETKALRIRADRLQDGILRERAGR